MAVLELFRYVHKPELSIGQEALVFKLEKHGEAKYGAHIRVLHIKEVATDWLQNHFGMCRVVTDSLVMEWTNVDKFISEFESMGETPVILDK